MAVEQLRRNAEDTRRKMGRPGISVFAADVGTHAEVIQAAGVRLPHQLLRLSWAGRLQPTFPLEPTLTAPHHTIWLPVAYDDDTLLDVADRFDPPLPREQVEGVEESASG
jgi:hypothetical protein